MVDGWRDGRPGKAFRPLSVRLHLRPKMRKWLRWSMCQGLAILIGLGPAGCTRRFYRHAADKEVDEVLAEKDQCPDWKIEQYHVYPDLRARFGDPTDPDHPPMPPDDPAARCLAPNPQGPRKAGIAFAEGEGYLSLLDAWDKENRAEVPASSQSSSAAEASDGGAPAPAAPGSAGQSAETLPQMPRPVQPNAEARPVSQGPSQEATQEQPAAAPERPSATTSLATKLKPGERPPYLIKLEQAVELGLINSREYQDAREDLYLTALPVTLERFAFGPQLFAAGEAIREWAGPQSPVGHQNNWRFNSNAGVARLFSTGALLLMNFANQTVIHMTGGMPHVTSQSFINLDFLQPFLQGGGFAVTLEPLTQAERNLLYEIRNFARFRKEFYVAIAGGGGGSITGANFQPQGIIAPQGFAPTAGVSGSSGLVPGVIPIPSFAGNPGLQVGPGPSGRIALSTGLTAPVSGYLTTLLQAAQMRVDEYNIEKLVQYLDLARAMKEGGDVSELQVQQFEQQLLNRRTTLLNDQLQYLQSIEQFKLQLGLPESLHIELDDSAFRPLNTTFRRYEDLLREFEATSNEPYRYGAEQFVPQVRSQFHRILTTSLIVRGTRFSGKVAAVWNAWEKLSAVDLKKRLSELREQRRQLQDKKAELEARRQSLSPADQARLDELDFDITVGEFESLLRTYESQPWRTEATAALRRRRQEREYHYVVDAFTLVLAEARNERVIQLRGEWPTLARLCVDGVDLLKVELDEAETKVTQVALANRLDLMNVRAQLVDAWRQLRIFANALLGTFNVEYTLNSVTPPTQPFNFSAAGTQQQLILQGQPPLVRKAQRNNYRAALINYQRSRRVLQSAEDFVAYAVRGEILLLRQQEENYRIQQRQVELAYLTVENSLDTFKAPPAPGQQVDTATRAAALTSQLISAQSALYAAQFAMTTIWITYLNTRLTLYRDMELMPLNLRGVWIDDIAKCQCPEGDASRRARLGFTECELPGVEPAAQRDQQPR